MEEADERETKLKFVLDFRAKAERKVESEISIGELLYRVLMGEGERPMQEGMGDS